MSATADRRIAAVAGHLAAGPASTLTPQGVSGTKKPVKVVVTGAAGNIAYAIVFMIGQGRMLGPDQPIELRLLDLPMMADKLKGVEMELADCAFPLLTKIVPTTDYKTAFQDVDIALLIGAKPRKDGESRADLLKANAAIFAGQGKALNAYASRNVKVLVVGNPANTNALLTLLNAPDIPKENFTAMTRLDQNRASSQIAARANVPVAAVKNVIIWGNHSDTQFPDVNHAVIFAGRVATPVRKIIQNDNFLNDDFIKTVARRGGAVIKARGSSSAASAASAAVDHVRDWILGTGPGEFVSMGVHSDGSYGVPKGLIYSFPCSCKNGSYTIVSGLKIDEFSQQKMKATAEELVKEKQDATSL